jgi:hypothetical protein
MKAWLGTRGVEYSVKDTKIELFEKIKRNRGSVIYQVDSILAEYGHSTVSSLPSGAQPN